MRLVQRNILHKINYRTKRSEENCVRAQRCSTAIAIRFWWKTMSNSIASAPTLFEWQAASPTCCRCCCCIGCCGSFAQANNSLTHATTSPIQGRNQGEKERSRHFGVLPGLRFSVLQAPNVQSRWIVYMDSYGWNTIEMQSIDTDSVWERRVSDMHWTTKNNLRAPMKCNVENQMPPRNFARLLQVGRIVARCGDIQLEPHTPSFHNFASEIRTMIACCRSKERTAAVIAVCV